MYIFFDFRTICRRVQIFNVNFEWNFCLDRNLLLCYFYMLSTFYTNLFYQNTCTHHFTDLEGMPIQIGTKSVDNKHFNSFIDTTQSIYILLI